MKYYITMITMNQLAIKYHAIDIIGNILRARDSAKQIISADFKIIS